MQKILTRNEDIQWKLIDGKVVLLDLNEARSIILNEVGSEVWLLLANKNNTEELIHELMQKFQVDAKRLKKDISLFLDEMINRDLIKAE